VLIRSMRTWMKFEDRTKSWLLAGAIATVANGWLGLAPARATVLSPGDSDMAPDVLTLGPHSGLVASISGPLNAPFFSGHYSEMVLTDSTNVWGARDLTWIITVTVSKSSFDTVGRVAAGSFADFNVDVGYQTGIAGRIPHTVDRLTAATIGFNFVPGIHGGEDSTFLEIETNATQFRSGVLDINPGIAGDEVPGFAPFAPRTVPEPSIWALMGLGFAGLGLFKIAKSRRKAARCTA
jgi:hypothetical protein